MYPKVPVVTLYVTTFIKSCSGKGVIVKSPPSKSIFTLPVTSKLPVIWADPV